MPKFDPQKHHRRSIRLQGYDYSSAGGYYVTIVAWQRECLFGEVVNKEMVLSRYGEIVQKWWEEIPVHFTNVETGAFIVMPNHVHGIIVIAERRGTVPMPGKDPNIEKMGLLESENKFLEQGDGIREDISTNMGGETPPLRVPTIYNLSHAKIRPAKTSSAFHPFAGI